MSLKEFLNLAGSRSTDTSCLSCRQKTHRIGKSTVGYPRGTVMLAWLWFVTSVLWCPSISRWVRHTRKWSFIGMPQFFFHLQRETWSLPLNAWLLVQLTPCLIPRSHQQDTLIKLSLTNENQPKKNVELTFYIWCECAKLKVCKKSSTYD